tara:strand:- start:23 stop:595 length:573 start_codon:yes stop_codon:yes gene_type:complete
MPSKELKVTDKSSAEDELLRPLEDHELVEGKEKAWKHIVKAIGVLLVILISSYMLTSYSIRSIIAGMADSEKIESNKLESKYGTVLLSENVYHELRNLYHANEKEFKACLIGDFIEGNYKIKNIHLPKIHFQDYDKVISTSCPDSTIIDLHSHPQQHCTFSKVDIDGFVPKKDNAMLAVMCSDDRFIFHK